MTLKSLVAVTLLALGSATVQAASTDLSLGPYTVTSNKVDSALFTDTFNFNFVGASGLLSASAIEYGLGKYIDIAWPSVNAFTVFGGWDGQGSTLLSLGDPGQKTGVFIVEDLPVPSHFSIVIQGQAMGNGASAFQLGLKGSYGLSAMAQPVPEPGTGLMLLSGLVVLAVPTLLRKRNDRSLYGRDAI